MRVVELTNMNGQSEVVLFPKTEECDEITEEVKDEIFDDFDPNNPGGLFYNILLDLDNYREWLKEKVKQRKKWGKVYTLVSEKYIYSAKFFLFVISLVMNFVLLVDN